MAKRKSKIEIIEETANFYNLTNRSILLNTGSCVYVAGEKRCAFSRCCTEEGIEILKEHEGYNVTMLKTQKQIDIDNLLKEEYRGHKIEFWLEIQKLHDNINFWVDNGISVVGTQFVNKLKAQYEKDTVNVSDGVTNN